jgi:glycogen debranching enzyme
VVHTLEQAKVDLAALRLYDLDESDRAWVMAAGLPIYVALFGRDVLTAGWGSSLLSHDMMKGALAEMARWQGTRVDDWRDEQPGRMLHEAHSGPLAKLGYNPRSRYYGATTTSSFYPVAVAELWHWTGDKGLVKSLLKPALRAMRWKDDYANLRGDGFSYYKSRSEQGNKNQGWKDSGDAIVRADGSEVEPPIATCEEQAYVYVSKLHMSEVLWFLGEHDLAKKLFHEARDLKERFNDAFWMDDQQFFAMGLDSKGKQIDAIASNPGHCLAAGIVKEEYVLPTARRLMSDELFSGWGVRTLSTNNPAFDPYSYHRGSVWPVEQGTFALGFMRYGLHSELHRLSHALFEAARLFPYHRLPECFGGQARDEQHPFPALYPKANWPQAWSASSVFTIMQSMLGIYPFAPMHVLLLDPHLPEWLPEITLNGLRVGKAVVSLRFYRRGEATHYEVIEKRGKLHIVRQPSPWSVSATYAERFRDAIESMVA